MLRALIMGVRIAEVAVLVVVPVPVAVVKRRTWRVNIATTPPLLSGDMPHIQEDYSNRKDDKKQNVQKKRKLQAWHEI